MPSKQRNFFATYNDIGKVLEQFEAGEHVVYVLAGLFDIDTPQFFETYRAINSLSVSLDGNVHHMPAYLIVTEANQISIRKVPQKTGETKFAIDQSQNQNSLYLHSGGVFSDKIIVPGTVGIAYQTPESRKLYDAFAENHREGFS